MPQKKLTTRTRIALLMTLLVLESVFVVSLRTAGWFETGNALHLFGCVLAAGLPLLVALFMLVRNRFRFSLRAILIATTLVAIFLYVSLIPILNYRAARSASMQLVTANATLNEGIYGKKFYAGLEMTAPPEAPPAKSITVPPWLTPFIEQISNIPPDDTVLSLYLNNDEQIRIFAEHWERFPILQSVSVGAGVSKQGLKQLQTTLTRFEYLECVSTHDVIVPKGWYRSLTNVRTLWVWGEGQLRGTPFSHGHLQDIVSLPDLEMFMVLGYAFNDQDAHTLSASPSIKRIILRGTTVTKSGEAELIKSALDRLVFRN